MKFEAVTEAGSDVSRSDVTIAVLGVVYIIGPGVPTIHGDFWKMIFSVAWNSQNVKLRIM